MKTLDSRLTNTLFPQIVRKTFSNKLFSLKIFSFNVII